MGATVPLSSLCSLLPEARTAPLVTVNWSVERLSTIRWLNPRKLGAEIGASIGALTLRYRFRRIKRKARFSDSSLAPFSESVSRCDWRVLVAIHSKGRLSGSQRSASLFSKSSRRTVQGSLTPKNVVVGKLRMRSITSHSTSSPNPLSKRSISSVARASRL